MDLLYIIVLAVITPGIKGEACEQCCMPDVNSYNACFQQCLSDCTSESQTTTTTTPEPRANPTTPPPVIRLIKTATDQPSPADNADSGRLEVFVNGQWGTVCGSSFDDRDASVACKQLGGEYSGTGEYLIGTRPVLGTGNIWLTDVECNGPESSLLECEHPGIGVGNDDCSHFEDVAIKCYKN